MLSYVGLSTSDKLFFVGDLVVRGPKPHEVVALARAHGAIAVRGNHEDRLLRWKKSKGSDHEIRIGAGFEPALAFEAEQAGGIERAHGPDLFGRQLKPAQEVRDAVHL